MNRTIGILLNCSDTTHNIRKLITLFWKSHSWYVVLEPSTLSLNNWAYCFRWNASLLCLKQGNHDSTWPDQVLAYCCKQRTVCTQITQANRISCAGYNLQIHKTDHITSLLIWYTLRSILIIKPWSQMADGINLLSSLHCREWDRCLTSQAYEGHTNRHAWLPWTALCIETFFKFPHVNYHGMTCLVLCSKMLHKIGYMNLYCM